MVPLVVKVNKIQPWLSGLAHCLGKQLIQKVLYYSLLPTPPKNLTLFPTSICSSTNDPFFYEDLARKDGYDLIAGTDEAGRGSNSNREDVDIVRTPELEQLQTDRLLPPSERGVIRWDENPWKAVQGDGGYTESDGVWWLLPYWMGRHYGYIQPPQPGE